MGKRAGLVKIALLALPLAAGTAALHAAGEPAGRAVRRMVVLASYPARDHGPFLIRVRRGSDYHEAVARTLEEFVRVLSSSYGLEKPPVGITVLVVESEGDLLRFGFDPQGLDRGGLRDAASRTIALVTGGRIYHPEQDARILRREMARLAFSGVPRPWLVSGIGSVSEAVPSGAPEGVRLSEEDLPSLAELLSATEASFRGPGGVRFAESARLLVAFLMNEEREALQSLLRGGSPSPLEDLPALEARWRQWVRLAPPKRAAETPDGSRPK